MKHFRLDGAAVVLAGTTAAREYFEPIFLERKQELTVVALCDASVRINQLLTFPGTVHTTEISLRNVFEKALGCHGMLVAHNHPSGNQRPSNADLRLTRKLCQICEAIEVTLLDHLIFAAGKMFSFRQAGLI